MKGYVLIVDDDEDARVLLGAVLMGLGLPHVCAVDGFEAVALIERRPPSLILLDLIMPGMNGFDVVSHLRANRMMRHIPVVVYSSFHPTQMELLKLQGVAQIILKGADAAIEQIEIIAGAVLKQTGLDHLARRPNLIN